VRFVLAAGLLLVGVGNLAAIDLVLLPRYLAGAARVGSPPPPSPPAAATPRAELPVVLPPPSSPLAEAPSLAEPAQPPSIEAPTAEAPAAEVPASAPAPGDLAEPAFPHLLFASNTSWLSPAAREILARLATALAENPSRRVLLGGHTDNVGPEDLNRALSVERARKCGRWLEGRGIAPERIETQGFGSTRPVAGDPSAEAEAHNRRVEIDLR
jgi:outer membrane protein OmpA-like peptidoglycan-associated protein